MVLSFFPVDGGTGIATTEAGRCGCGAVTRVFVNRDGRTECLSCAHIAGVDRGLAEAIAIVHQEANHA